MHHAEESLKGISLNKMLILLAHYRLIEDERALQYVRRLSLALVQETDPCFYRLDELAKRRRKQDLVTTWVDMDRVNSFLRMVVLRRRFLAHLDAKRQNRLSSLPAINITDEGHDEPERYGEDEAASTAAEPPHGRPSVSFAD